MGQDCGWQLTSVEVVSVLVAIVFQKQDILGVIGAGDGTTGATRAELARGRARDGAAGETSGRGASGAENGPSGALHTRPARPRPARFRSS